MEGTENKKTNPMAGCCGITDEEFAFFEEFHKIERRAHWKGVVIGCLLSGIICILTAIAR